MEIFLYLWRLSWHWELVLNSMKSQHWHKIVVSKNGAVASVLPFLYWNCHHISFVNSDIFIQYYPCWNFPNKHIFREIYDHIFTAGFFFPLLPFPCPIFLLKKRMKDISRSFFPPLLCVKWHLIHLLLLHSIARTPIPLAVKHFRAAVFD